MLHRHLYTSFRCQCFKKKEVLFILKIHDSNDFKQIIQDDSIELLYIKVKKTKLALCLDFSLSKKGGG